MTLLGQAPDERARASARWPSTGGRAFSAPGWGWLLVRGLLAIALAIATIFFPFAALFAFTMLIAAYALVDGIAALVSGFRGNGAGDHWLAMILRGIAGVAVGVLFFALPLVAAATYAYVSVLLLAFWMLLSGVLEIAAAIRLRRSMGGEWLLGLAGCFALLLGVAIFIFIIPSPAATIVSAAWLIMLYAWATGITFIMQALRLRGATPL